MNPTINLVSEIHYDVRRMSTILLYIITLSYVKRSWHQQIAFLNYSIALDKCIAFLNYSIALDKCIFSSVWLLIKVICKLLLSKWNLLAVITY